MSQIFDVIQSDVAYKKTGFLTSRPLLYLLYSHLCLMIYALFQCLMSLIMLSSNDIYASISVLDVYNNAEFQ